MRNFKRYLQREMPAFLFALLVSFGLVATGAVIGRIVSYWVR